VKNRRSTILWAIGWWLVRRQIRSAQRSSSPT
jgi:hypothetical protein